MNLEIAKSIFLLAGMEATRFNEISNQYWPDVPEYAERRRNSPWWLVETPYGLIRIGWRKRVISIGWESLSWRGKVTSDAVTQTDTLVHAWSYAKAVEYLGELRARLEKEKKG